MNEAKRITVSMLGIAIVTILVEGASAADARSGETLAKRWCATCHIIASDQQRGTTQAPPFSAIASTPNFNGRALAFFLLMPHPRMPDMNLSRKEADDLAAFIETQK